MSFDGAAIVAEGIEKRFGQVKALDGIDLEVHRGTVLSLLGPNGAGKTTTLRILTTLLKPDRGRATVAGFDVVSQAEDLRAHIGLTGQFAAVDEYLTGRENLELVGRLYHLPRDVARRRADELLERFDLVDAAHRTAKTYSGGMRRRLDIAASLVVSPPILFLDEPTTGLDPRSRLSMWNLIEDLVGEGTTVLLTTQYLDEADRLAHTVAVIDHGRVIASGTPGRLKEQIGGERLEVIVRPDSNLDAAVELVRSHTSDGVRVDAERRHLIAPVSHGPSALVAVASALDRAGIGVEDVSLRRPTLDEVFLTLVGRSAGEEESE